MLNQNIATQTESFNLTELRFKNGVTTELDVQQATALLNNTKASVPPLRTDLAQAKNALAVLTLNIPFFTVYLVILAAFAEYHWLGYLLVLSVGFVLLPIFIASALGSYLGLAPSLPPATPR